MSIEQTTDFVIPSDPEVRKKIAKMLQEVSNSFLKISAERDLIRETVKEVSKEHTIPKTYLNKIARIYHKGSIDKVSTDNEMIEELYRKLFGHI